MEHQGREDTIPPLRDTQVPTWLQPEFTSSTSLFLISQVRALLSLCTDVAQFIPATLPNLGLSPSHPSGDFA